MSRFSKILDMILLGLFYFAMFLVFVMVVIICSEVVSRYFFNRPSIWVVDITGYILLYITFLGAAWLAREKGHVMIEVLTSRLSSETQRLLTIVTNTIGAIFCFFFAIWTGLEFWKKLIAGTLVIELFEVPEWTILIIIPIGSLLLGITLASHAIIAQRNK